MIPNTGPLRKPTFGCNHTENIETFPSSPSASAPKTAIAERTPEEGRGRKQRAHQVLYAPGPLDVILPGWGQLWG